MDAARLIVLLAIAEVWGLAFRGWATLAGATGYAGPRPRLIATAADAVAERRLSNMRAFSSPHDQSSRRAGHGFGDGGFENGFLELIWADAAYQWPAAARRQQRFAERAAWRRTGASPFGVALVRTPDTPASFVRNLARHREWMQPEP